MNFSHLATSSPLMDRIWSPGISLSTLGPPPVTNLKHRSNIRTWIIQPKLGFNSISAPHWLYWMILVYKFVRLKRESQNSSHVLEFPTTYRVDSRNWQKVWGHFKDLKSCCQSSNDIFMYPNMGDLCFNVNFPHFLNHSILIRVVFSF